MSHSLPSTSAKESKTLSNMIIALVAIALSIAIFLGLNYSSTSVSLEAQAQKSIPLEVALTNGKPTLTEFYANWCATCQAMAPDLAQLKQQYGDRLNFVMLNVDNNKWLPEVLRYRVDGIPHFVFLDQEGREIGQAIGEQPLSIMEANLEALISDLTLPYAHAIGQSSKVEKLSRNLE